MKKQTFDYQGALDEGYSDEEIADFLRQDTPDFDFDAAIAEGYSPQEINEFLTAPKKRGALEKAGRMASQFGTALLEAELLPYDLAVAPLASKDAQNMAYRGQVGEDIERLQEQKAMGLWDDQDQELYDSLVQQIKDPQKSGQYGQTADIGVRSLLEKGTGLDLQPEGFLEHAANFAGYVKDPSKLAQGLANPKEYKQIIKNILPNLSETSRAAGAAAGYAAAEEGEFGPIGQMAAIVVGDIIGGGGKKLLTTNPKKTIANTLALFSKKEASALNAQIMQDFKDAGMSIDLGTASDNNLIKMIQSRLAQSGFTGKEFDELRQKITKEVVDEYKGLANELGELKYTTDFEAGTAAKELITRARDEDKEVYREFYKQAEESIGERPYVRSEGIANNIAKLEKSLTPGSIKSKEQTAVLDVINDLKKDVLDSSGAPMMADVRDLMNNKIAISDLINYEVEGGAKQLLKGIVKDLDDAILTYGKENKTFAKNYLLGNKNFKNHVETFRNKDVGALLRGEDPAKILSRMNSQAGINKLKATLKDVEGGKELFDSLSRYKMEELVGKNMLDGTKNQLKTGSFSKLLHDDKTREILKAITPPEAYRRLERLTKNVGKLADSQNKFFNSSQSAVAAGDVAFVLAGMKAVADILSGNPWTLFKVTGGYATAKGLSHLLTDPAFLKYYEEAIKASARKSPAELQFYLEKLRPYFVEVFEQKSGEPAGSDDRGI